MRTEVERKLFVTMLIASLVSAGYCKRVPNNQIRRDALSKEAIFLKAIENVDIKGSNLSFQENATLAQCARSCLREPECESFNYKRKPPTGCKIINGTVESAEFLAVANEGWDYYAPQKKRELPCKLLIDGKNADALSLALYGKVLTSSSAGSLCDLSNDGGGWTMVSYFNYALGYNTIDDISRMAEVENSRFILGQTGFVQLYRLFNFRQVRFYCYRPKEQRLLDIATADNETGDWVVAHLLGLVNNNRPPSCGSYYEIPPSSIYLTTNCNVWTDQKWRAVTHFLDIPFDAPGGYSFAPLSGICSLNNQDSAYPNLFKIFVR